ncbi:MAG TPA: hypothetical protein VJU77_12030 [Chthoniobacterales bacterium]|nr:hypothetical protein [Chthoniobacterales bacterium]
MNKNRTLLALALLTLASVSSAQAEEPKASTDYFPLRVGDSWTYRNSADQSEYTLKVLGEEKQADGSVRYQVEKLAGPKDSQVKIHLWFSKAKGWVLLHGERYPEHEGLEAKYEPPKQYLPSPPAPEAKWEWSGKDYTQTPMLEKNRVVGSEEITVPAGKFRAMKVVSEVTGSSAPVTKTYWYADGVGLVKTTSEAGEIKYGSELADYSFKKK